MKYIPLIINRLTKRVKGATRREVTVIQNINRGSIGQSHLQCYDALLAIVKVNIRTQLFECHKARLKGVDSYVAFKEFRSHQSVGSYVSSDIVKNVTLLEKCLYPFNGFRLLRA